MQILSLIIAVSLPAVLGYQILNIFFLKPGGSVSHSEKLFLGFGLGFGAITLGMFFLSFLGGTFNGVFLAATGAGTALLFLYNRAKTPTALSPFVPGKLSLPVFLLNAWITFNIAQVVFRTMIVDIDLWDSWAFWAFKAKIFFVHKTIPFELFSQFKTVWGNWDYPLHVPLMETWVLIWAGSWNDILPRAIFPVFFTGICLMCFFFLRRRTGQIPSLIGTGMVTSIPILQICTIGTIAEPVFLFYYLSSFFLLCHWHETHDTRAFLLSAILGGLALWSKSEALLYVSGNLLVIFSLMKNQPRPQVLKITGTYALILLLISCPWNIYTTAARIENHIFHSACLQTTGHAVYLERIQNLHAVFLSRFKDFSSWNIVWILFLMAFLLNIFRRRRDLLTHLLLLNIVLQWVLIAIAYIIWPLDEMAFVEDTMTRLLLAPATLTVLYFSLSLSESSEKQ